MLDIGWSNKITESMLAYALRKKVNNTHYGRSIEKTSVMVQYSSKNREEIFCAGGIFLHWAPVAYWASTDLGSFPFQYPIILPFILFMGFSRQEYWSGLPFPSPVDHILSDLSTMTHPSWAAPWAWLSFTELDKAVVLLWLDWLVFCDYGLCVCPLMPLTTPSVLPGFLLTWTCGIKKYGTSRQCNIIHY